MKLIGIVSEYNPFHNGHAYQVQKSVQNLEADGVVAIMSGNFVQRGYPAIYDKWLRAQMAVLSGVNLVIELPTYYATSSAESFAQGAIELLDATGVISHLSFGSEYDNIIDLEHIADVLLKPSDLFNETLSQSLKKGLSFPASREMALNAEIPSLNKKVDLNQSNLILGVEYLKALKKINSSIKPFALKRVGKDYHDSSLNSSFVSATAIRHAYFNDETELDLSLFMPSGSANAMKSTEYSATKIEDFEKLLIYTLRKSSPKELSKIKEVSEGLENKLYDAGLKCSNYSELISAVKSKRYTMTRINRILLNVLLGIEHDCHSLKEFGYFRVLAFDKTGQKIINEIKKNGSHPIITNINKHHDLLKSNPLMALDIKATNIYHLAQHNTKHQLGGRDYLQKPYQRI